MGRQVHEQAQGGLLHPGGRGRQGRLRRGHGGAAGEDRPPGPEQEGVVHLKLNQEKLGILTKSQSTMYSDIFIHDVFSCEDAALQVLMYVCPSVRLSVTQVENRAKQ